ncbi:integrating conjugative element protein [Pseudomonas aeruginosa]|nr:integrating conjugative element protein [Pseudomonas aeruginosa]
MSLLLASRRLRATVASLLLSTATSTFALDTATIVSSALSPDCLEYRVVGICYWLYCTPFGCSVRTSVQGAPLRPRCGGVELLEHRRKSVAGGQGDEHAQPDRQGGR